MNWKFWERNSGVKNASKAQAVKLARPKELPDRVGMHLVTQLKEDPDWVWSLKAAVRPKADEPHAFDIRIFDPADALRKGVNIKSYNSLDEHADMILFAGWFNKRTGITRIDRTMKKVA